jgi:hypothetical protein
LRGKALGAGIDASVGRITGIQLGAFLDQESREGFPFALPTVLLLRRNRKGISVAMILEKFKIILDYKNNRVILEPNARFDDSD